jgi:heme oxygenase
MKTLRAVGRVLLGLLRELSDQNAYARHLARHGATHSGAEWRRFTEHRFKAKYSRPKCC